MNYSVADIPIVLDKRIVLISKACFGPAEIDELGIDENKNPFELHNWCEDGNYCRNISVEELIEKIEDYILVFQNQNLDNGVDSCKKIVTWLKAIFT